MAYFGAFLVYRSIAIVALIIVDNFATVLYKLALDFKHAVFAIRSCFHADLCDVGHTIECSLIHIIGGILPAIHDIAKMEHGLNCP